MTKIDKKKTQKDVFSMPSKKIIAIDIDMTILSCDSIFYKIFNIGTGKKRFLTSIRNFLQKHRGVVFDDSKIYKPTILNKLIGLFNPKKYAEIQNAIKNINDLSKEYSIFLVTSRPQSKTLNYLLQENVKGINYDYIITNCSDKGEMCEKLQSQFLIDNSIHYCLDASKNGVTKPICFGSEHFGTKKSVLHSGNWNFIHDYIRFLRPLQKSADKPFTTFGLQQEFDNKMHKVMCDYGFFVQNLDTILPKQSKTVAKFEYFKEK